MKITHTSIVFAQKVVQASGPLVVSSNSYAQALLNNTIMREIVKPIAQQLSSFGQFFPAADNMEIGVVSTNKYDNGFSFLGDTSKGQVSYEKDLMFSDTNPIPLIAHQMLDLLTKTRSLIEVIGFNINGRCDITTGKQKLHALINASHGIFALPGFDYAPQALVYNFGNTPDRKAILKLQLDIDGQDIVFSSNFGAYISD